MRLALVLFVACTKPAAIAPDKDSGAMPVDAGATLVVDASDDAPIADASDPDACVPGDTWDARVRVRNTWHADAKMMLPGPLELVVPRTGAKKTLYPDCGMTGGGCGDCSKPRNPDTISCELTPARVKVDIGVDDMGPTWVEVFQRGNTIVADHAYSGPFEPGTAPKTTHTTEVLVTLPCAVKIRFVR